MLSLHIIEELLDERKTLLVSFCRLAALDAASADAEALALLDRFCQTMVDYAGLVHFEVYEKLAEDAAARPLIGKEAGALYQPLVDNTERLVDFNDKYDRSRPDFSLTSLEEDLSGLGERLVDRFDLEDRLIRLLQQLPSPAESTG